MLTLVAPTNFELLPLTTALNNSLTTVNAVGESRGVIGRVRLAGGSAGGTKTISSAGGKIWFPLGATLTWANGASTLRLGIQDVDTATGLEDGTYDVNGDLAGGAGLTATAWNKVSMGTGSKTLTHGDLIAVVGEMTARGGTDSVQLAGASTFGLSRLTPPSTLAFPYGTADTGLLGKFPDALAVLIEFDDGTFGWIDGFPCYGIVGALGTPLTLLTYNSGSSPDEYCACFPGLPATVEGIGIYLNSLSSGAFELILYQDPLGAPAVIETVTPDMDVMYVAGTNQVVIVPITPTRLHPGVTYGVAFRPTSGTDVNLRYVNFGSGFSDLKRMGPFGMDYKMASRADQTGAFAETQTYHALPAFLQLTAIGEADAATAAAGLPFRTTVQGMRW